MANDLTSNPRIVDVVVTSGAAVTVISKPTKVILVQWVNLGTAEIADGSDLSLTVNSATFAIKAAAVGEVPYEVSPGTTISNLVVNVMDAGAVLVWTA